MIRVRVHRWQDSVSRDPVKKGAGTRAVAPLRETPAAIGIGVLVTLELARRIIDVAEAIGQINDLRAGLGFGGGRSRELPFVEVIDFHGHARQQDRFGARNPIEVRVPQE